MFRSIKQLYGDKLGASDGEIGHVKDFYFDDRNWAVRYLVVDTGSWLTGRQVLISPHAFVRLDQPSRLLSLKLTRKQIENSPSIDTHKPVSRQYEEAYYQYYGWPSYWEGDALWGTSRFPVLGGLATAPAAEGSSVSSRPEDTAETHLRSTVAVSGYHIRATDGAIGHVCDFLMDEQSWAIGHLIVKIGHRFSGIEVQISAATVEKISYEDSTVFVNMTRKAIEDSPVYHLAPEVVAG
jgi:hypothetical protein